MDLNTTAPFCVENPFNISGLQFHVRAYKSLAGTRYLSVVAPLAGATFSETLIRESTFSRSGSTWISLRVVALWSHHGVKRFRDGPAGLKPAWSQLGHTSPNDRQAAHVIAGTRPSLGFCSRWSHSLLGLRTTARESRNRRIGVGRDVTSILGRVLLDDPTPV